MPVFAHDNTDEDILKDLLEEINELYEASEQTLIELEINPDDNELQRSLFRSVHTIKGDLGLVGFTPLFGMMQHGEDLLDMLRKGQLAYCSDLSDVVLLILDLVKHFVGQCIHEGQVEYDEQHFTDVVKQVEKVTQASAQEQPFYLAQAVAVLKGQAPSQDKPTVDTLTQDTLTRSGIPKDADPLVKAELLFFREMMQTVEKRVTALQGRGDRMSQLAHLINTHAGHAIDDLQLTVACYTHDFGMAFMPQHIVNKPAKTEQEQHLLRSHVYKSGRLLEHLTMWDGARKIVMQHHERYDGSGYPLGLVGDDICPGAKLLAILDTFYELHHEAIGTEHEYAAQKKALVLMNKEYQHLFCPEWFGHFNQTITRIVALH
jgi:HD-GYP domain-containing protein (c-di-GMP phosphodiesterase class II)